MNVRCQQRSIGVKQVAQILDTTKENKKDYVDIVHGLLPRLINVRNSEILWLYNYNATVIYNYKNACSKETFSCQLCYYNHFINDEATKAV